MKKKILFALCLVFCLGAAGFYIKNKESEPADKEAQPVYEILNENTEDKSSAKTEKIYDETGPDKTETVRIKADRYGNKKEVTVETTLKAGKDGDVIEDFTTLTDIKNKEGDEEYTLSDDGTIIWQNKGDDIKYRGKTDKELPITVKVTYYLEGKQVTAQEIAGKAGNVKIRFDYQNNTAGYFTEDGVKTKATVPFAAISAVFLDSEKFADVKVENGKAVKADGSIAAIGYALPGLSRGLNLKGYEATKEIDLPEYVEISAYTTDFQIEYTATVFTNGLFEDIKNSDLKDIDDLRGDLDDMQQGVGKMSDGLMVGEKFAHQEIYQKRELGENVLELNGLSGHGFSNVNLTVKKGSIVGLTGLQGSGSSELLQGLFGAVPVTGGTLKVSGKECRIHGIQGAMKAGIAMLASNRKENSVIPDMSILENMYLSEQVLSARQPLISAGRERERYEKYKKLLSIKAADPKDPITSLSGGNQQKVFLARRLNTEAGILLLDNPTQGIDVGAKAEIYKLILKLADAGKTILINTLEIPELAKVADCCAVFYEGTIIKMLQHEEIDEKTVMLYSTNAAQKGES